MTHKFSRLIPIPNPEPPDPEDPEPPVPANPNEPDKPDFPDPPAPGNDVSVCLCDPLCLPDVGLDLSLSLSTVLYGLPSATSGLLDLPGCFSAGTADDHQPTDSFTAVEVALFKLPLFSDVALSNLLTSCAPAADEGNALEPSLEPSFALGLPSLTGLAIDGILGGCGPCADDGDPGGSITIPSLALVADALGDIALGDIFAGCGTGDSGGDPGGDMALPGFALPSLLGLSLDGLLGDCGGGGGNGDTDSEAGGHTGLNLALALDSLSGMAVGDLIGGCNTCEEDSAADEGSEGISLFVSSQLDSDPGGDSLLLAINALGQEPAGSFLSADLQLAGLLGSGAFDAGMGEAGDADGGGGVSLDSDILPSIGTVLDGLISSPDLFGVAEFDWL